MVSKLNDVRVGLIGAGKWGSNIARVLKELEQEGLLEFELIVDIDVEKAKVLARKYGVPKYSDNINDARVLDAVAIVVSIPYLAKTAMKAASMNLDLFVEKPVATSLRELEELKREAESRKLVAVPGFIMRFNPVVEYIREEASRLGVNVLELRRLSRRPPHARRNNILLDLAVHDIDIANYILADKAEPMLKAWMHMKVSSDEVVKIVLDYDGVPAMIHVDGISPAKVREIDLITPEYFIRGNTDNNTITYLKTGEPPRTIKVNGEEPLKRELREWIRRVKGEKSSSPTLDDAWMVLRILDPILRRLD